MPSTLEMEKKTAECGRPTTADGAMYYLLDALRSTGTAVTTRNEQVLRVTPARVNPVRFTSTPLVHGRRTYWQGALYEWEWFMSGSSNLAHLDPRIHDWWKPWADGKGYVNYNYSEQFRAYTGISKEFDLIRRDQVEYLVTCLKEHPNGRRAVATTWHPAQMSLRDCPITNCHGTVVQVWEENGKVDMYTYQRSCDVMLGVPHNWVQYWAFLLWLAARTNLRPGTLTWQGGDVHVYQPHFEVAEKLYEFYRAGKIGPRPELTYAPTEDPHTFRAADFRLAGPEYKPVLNDKLEMVV